MKSIGMFNFVTVDGFFAGPDDDIDWFKMIEKDKEWEEYSGKSATGGNTLVFGRKTYEMMKSYWPTSYAIESDPVMAGVMNNSPKIVFSKTLKSVNDEPNWKNIRLLKEINTKEIESLKEKENMTILGSGSIVQQLTNLRLMDEYSLAVVPVLLGNGKSLFQNVKLTNFKPSEAKTFRNGIVFINYKTKK